MDFNSLIQQGAAHAWIYLPTAVLLGGLHGLEPGHSKTMMAAFIIAVRGTVLQAALLGLSAAISHSLVIWLLAALALKFGNQWNVETTEPYFLMATGIIVMGMAAWTIWRLRRDQKAPAHDHDCGHDHEHDHDHGHGHGHHHDHGHGHDEIKRFTTSEGDAVLSVYEEGVPPRFRWATKAESLQLVCVVTKRPGGEVQSFSFVKDGAYWESTETIPEPHEFQAEVVMKGPQGEIRVPVEFVEGHHHDEAEAEDAHAREHAEQIKRRFDGRTVTTPQIILFGLTGGLMPCPAALSILMICLQLKQVALGFSIVAAFSVGLAITLVTVGVAAAWSIKHFTQKEGVFSRLAHKAPYLSSGVLILLGLAFLVRGVMHLL